MSTRVAIAEVAPMRLRRGHGVGHKGHLAGAGPRLLLPDLSRISISTEVDALAFD